MKLNLKLIEEPFVLQVENESGNKLTLDASEAIGGKGKGMRPMELLASSLAGCMSIDVLSILRKKRAPVMHFEIQVEAHRREGIPSAFEEFVFVFVVDSGVSLEKLEQAAHLSHEKYCSVWASLDHAIKFSYTIQVLNT